MSSESSKYDLAAICDRCEQPYGAHRHTDNGCPDKLGGYTRSEFVPRRAPDDDLGQVLVPVSLRDWLAGQALAGICASAACSAANPTFDDVARKAYAQADAMLAARGGGKSE